MEVKFQYSYKRPFKLGVSKRIAEWVYGTVKVTQPVRKVVKCQVDASSVSTHSNNEHHHVIRGPT